MDYAIIFLFVIGIIPREVIMSVSNANKVLSTDYINCGDSFTVTLPLPQHLTVNVPVSRGINAVQVLQI